MSQSSCGRQIVCCLENRAGDRVSEPGVDRVPLSRTYSALSYLKVAATLRSARSPALQHDGDLAINRAANISDAYVLDVFLIAELARPSSGEDLAGRVCGLAPGVHKDRDLFQPGDGVRGC